MGEEGNLFHRTLVGPACTSLLALRPGERLLDVACGTGVIDRQLASQGVHVLGIDVSDCMLARARARGGGVEYRQVDCASAEALLALGAFDAVLCSMAWMDMPSIDPLLRATPGLLKPGGRLVAALCHPCFNLAESRMVLEQEDVGGSMRTRAGVTVFDYLTPSSSLGVGAPGEPNAHTYYHRPLHDLLGRCFAAGLVLDGLKEPAFEGPPALSWSGMSGVPPVLALRLRPRIIGG